MQQQYATSNGLRLAMERDNLEYVLSNVELTRQEESYLNQRLSVLQDELFQLFIADLPE